MKKIKINGNKELNGVIQISGAKNAAVALVPASILANKEVTLCNVPEISDIDDLENILKYLNVGVKRATESIVIDPSSLVNKEIPKKISSKLRASYYFMSALLGKYKKVEMYFPGGCNIGSRPIDQTIKVFEALGATVEEKNDRFNIYADELIGANVSLDMPSVGATINAILVSVLATGTTVIDNAAREPEIINVSTFLNSLGAKISGAGTSIIKITGVKELNGGFAEIIPDRIEAGTYIIAGALLGDNLKINNIIPSHIDALTSKLIEAGAKIEVHEDYVVCNKNENIKSVDINTFYFPGFPTDLQQPFVTFLTQCKGKAKVVENLYETRFMQVPYLNKMGANIKASNRKATVVGKTPLKGRKIKATDLRAGASLIIAGLIAKGTTIIEDAEHILRGYEGIIDKLTNVGAEIELIDE